MDLNTPDGAPKTAVDKAVAFLQRDIQSFLPGWKQSTGAEPATTVTSSPDATLPSLVDFGNIDYLVFRREVLDWRDGFHARVTLEAAEMNNLFAWRVKWGLSDVGILRRIITNSASKKLQDHFIRDVRVPMFVAIQREQSELAALVQTWLPQTQIELNFPAPWSDSECACLGDLNFTSKNEEKILEKIETLILGDNGIVDSYRTRATNLARRIIEERTQ